ncbi:MAG: EAL domain-containing protein [Proteobacteria bacterium]|nr:EAL domain-containing protein [Pseudomonadota bacterium]
MPSPRLRTPALTEAALDRALEKGELSLCYQPRLELGGLRLVAVEALMRWESPQNGVIAPRHFIPFAEETGQIEALGRFALETACRDYGRLCSASAVPLRVAVNVSPIQLTQPRFSEQLMDLLHGANVPPSALELEVTETVALQQQDRASMALEDLRGIGVRVALDDFGAGFSSLHTLTVLPLDVLKLDRSLIRNLVDDPKAQAIVESLLMLCHRLGLTVVAEGVDEPEQLDILRPLGCDEVQGFLFSKALDADAVVRWGLDHAARLRE